FQRQLIDFIRIAPIHVGGITEARKICVLAEAYAVRSAFHGAMDIGPIGQAAAVHLDKAIPNFGIQEWIGFPDQVREVITGGCRVENGYTNPPEAPGLGVDINEEAARKYPYRRAYMPTVRRVDGTMHVY
ncbi:MAG TPA: enolase C-terminal domain-like protein, partial [Chloroflexia bacterium]|nr:enolase C-terminal domain-like protein [Chloroflexia bacterium]